MCKMYKNVKKHEKINKNMQKTKINIKTIENTHVDEQILNA